MEPITLIRSTTVVLPLENIDTDQIIPARFLKTTVRQGLGANVFADRRYNADGSPNPEFPLNRPENSHAQILVAGNNFGCGSSREHAPWALLDAGIHAVVSTQIADIFRNNSMRNGLLPIIVDADFHRWLIAHPGASVTIDLQSNSITAAGGPSAKFPFDPFAKHCLVHGVDELGYLLSQENAIANHESKVSIA